MGRAVSDIALESLQRVPAMTVTFPEIDPVPGHVITDELVADNRDD